MSYNHNIMSKLTHLQKERPITKGTVDNKSLIDNTSKLSKGV
jgi:hypothetical protein